MKMILKANNIKIKVIYFSKIKVSVNHENE